MHVCALILSISVQWLDFGCTIVNTTLDPFNKDNYIIVDMKKCIHMHFLCHMNSRNKL